MTLPLWDVNFDEPVGVKGNAKIAASSHGEAVAQVRAQLLLRINAVQPLWDLYELVATIREAQVGLKIGFGSGGADRQRHATLYAAAISRSAAKIDDVLDAVARCTDPPQAQPE